MAERHDPRCDELLPGYALGALDADEVRELERLLAEEQAAAGRRQELGSWQAVAEELAAGVAPTTPSSELRARVMSRVAQFPAGDGQAADQAAGQERRPLAAPRAVARLPRWAALAAAALLLFGLWSAVRQASLGDQLRRLEAERARAERRAAALDQELRRSATERQRLAETVALIASRGVQSVALAGSGSAARAAGRAYVNGDEHRAVFYAFDLPRLPAGKTYELWFFAAGRPVPAGTFAPDPAGRGGIDVALAAALRPEGWAVTIEPLGGVPAPTGEIVLKG